MFDVIQNRHIVFGAGKVKEIPSLVRSFTHKKLLVMAFRDTVDFVIDILQELSEQDINYIVDASIHNEPETTDIDRVAKLARDNGCGAVLAIGGGSVMDAAKAVAMLVTNPGTVVDYQMNGKVVENPTVPLIAVPTTSGTGSEATKVSVVYNPDNGLKKSFYSPYMIADTVILDPEITATLPESVTISTGVDALSHAIESYVSLNATPYTEMYSLESMKRVVMSLKECVAHPDNIEARGNMMLASYFGGIAINAGIGLAHIIAQPLGGLIKIPHGVACAIYLPYAMKYNRDYSINKYCDIARIFGAEGNDSKVLADEGIQRVCNFLKELNAPSSISEYIGNDFDVDYAVKLVKGATGHIKCNPRPVDENILKEVIQSSIR